MRVGSVFSGVGMLDLGLTLAGFEHAWFCEKVPFRREILRLRWPGVRVYDDICTLNPEPVECIAGGFPCKGVSSAGKGEGFDHPETALWREMRRVIRQLRPRYVLVENVAALTSKHEGRLLGEVLGDLAESGYDTSWDCVPASALGAPHGRDRIFIVAHTPEPRLEGAEGQGLYRAGEFDRPEHATADAANAGGSGRGAELGDLRRGQPDASGSALADTKRGVHGCARRPDLPSPQGTGEGEAPERQRVRPDSADGGGIAWGEYEPAIREWEARTRPAPEPLLYGVADGPSRKLERSRLSALGDGVQVQVGEFVGRLILEHAAMTQAKAAA